MAISTGYDREMLMWDVDTARGRGLYGHTDHGYGVA